MLGKAVQWIQYWKLLATVKGGKPWELEEIDWPPWIPDGASVVTLVFWVPFTKGREGKRWTKWRWRSLSYHKAHPGLICCKYCMSTRGGRCWTAAQVGSVMSPWNQGCTLFSPHFTPRELLWQQLNAVLGAKWQDFFLLHGAEISVLLSLKEPWTFYTKTRVWRMLFPLLIPMLKARKGQIYSCCITILLTCSLFCSCCDVMWLHPIFFP